MTDSPLVTVGRDGHVLLIGINRPEKRNAFNLAVIDQFAAAYETLADDPELRVAVVYAHGDHFSAGLDLAEVGPAVAQSGPGALGGDHRFDPFGMWGPAVPKPVVIALQGIAYTLSIELALASDIVVAAQDVRFRQLEIGRGIMPFGGATIRAPKRLGWGNAMKFLLTAETFGADEAHHIGLVQEVVPTGTQKDRAVEIAQVIAAQAPLGVQATLANARIAVTGGDEAAKGHLVESLEVIMHSEDAQEGVMSFVERREARFTGR
jgi:enoyl-CoA hydratase